MDVKGRIPARDRVDAKPATMDARAKIPAKAKVDAKRLKTVVKERMVAPPVARSSQTLTLIFSKHSH
jgi:hypothetical protein